MKIIDLLNKKVSGEKLPQRIKYGEDIYCYDGDDYFSECNTFANLFDDIDFDVLNDDVEVLEEGKIEKLTTAGTFANGTINHQRIIDMQNKINEIIDYINNKEDK